MMYGCVDPFKTEWVHIFLRSYQEIKTSSICLQTIDIVPCTIPDSIAQAKHIIPRRL